MARAPEPPRAGEVTIRLTKLEIFGFKSFADRAVFEFAPGITALVGPNGSGKSNIVDALRWVFGEQNPRLLRGSRWDEVIFAGSASRRPLGLAEVLAVLDNSQGDLPVPYREVEVSRRLLRSGDGEYAVGRVPCRLKDIQDLTAGTGAGGAAYAYVPQAAVDEILKSRPEDRRAVIEEAAGLSRYRGRQQEAERRLAEVDESQRRLEDLRAEVAGQLEPLAADAAAAERYLALRTEHEDLSARLWADGVARAVRRLDSARDRAASLRATLEQLDAAAATLGEELGAARAAAAGLRRARAEADNLARTLLTEENRRRAVAAVLQERLAAAGRDQAGWDERLSRLQAKLAAVQAQVGADLPPVGPAAGTEGPEEQMGQVAEAARMVSELEASRLAAATAEREAMERLAAARAEQARRAEALRGAAARLQAASRRRSEHQRRVAAAEVAGREHRAQSERAAAEAALLLRRKDELESRRDDAGLELQRAAAVLAEARSTAGRLRAELAGARERWLALEALQGRLPLLAAARDAQAVAAPPNPDSPALLAGLLEVEEGMEQAVASALGLAQYALVAPDWPAVLAISAARRASGRPGAVVMVPARMGSPRDPRGDVAVPHAAARLSRSVRTGDPHRLPQDALDRLLDGFCLAEGLEEAIAAVEAGGGRVAAVTRSGQAVLPGGLVVDGPGAYAADLIGVPQEQASLGGRIERLEQDLAAAEAAESEAALRQGELAGMQQRLGSELAEASRLGQGASLARGRLAEAAAAAEARLETDRRLLGELDQELAVLTDLVREAQDADQASGQVLEAARLGAQETSRSLSGVVEKLRASRGHLESMRLALARRAQEQAVAQEKRARLAAEAETLARDLADGTGRAREVRAAWQRLSAEAGEAEAALASCQQQREAAEAGARQLAGELAAHDGSVRDRESELEKVSRARSEGQSKLHQTELVIERLEGDLRSLAVERRSLAARHWDLQPQLIEDAAGLRARRESLEVELERMGKVNLGAAEQVRRLAARRDFLEEQRRDLAVSAAALRASATELEREMEVRFLRCFEETRARFSGIFADLFGGGMGSLELTVPDRPLASGVEVLAQPPGKRMASLSLLSGGERALTAIAFLFALLGQGRRGFCVLDEVDAHLDEPNCLRFCRYLRSLAGQQQFLVVTHSKATMEAADVLYGLTMEEDGVSRAISVRLERTAGRAGA